MSTQTRARRLFYFCLIISVICTPPLALATESLSLEKAVTLAVTNNPGLAAIQARAQALAAIPDQRQSLPDPKLTLRMANLPLDTFSTTQEGMTQMQLGISQALPFPGTLSLLADAAKQESQAAAADVEEARLRLVKDTKILWWNIFFIDNALQTVKQNHALIKQFVTIAQTKYKVGKGSQQDVLLAQLELSKLIDTAITLKNKRHNQVTRLNTLLNQEPEQAIILTQAPLTALPVLPPLTDLQQQALKQRPILLAQQRKLSAARLRLNLAHKKYYPNFAVGAVYGYRDGNNPNGSSRADFATLGITMTLPIFNHTSLDAGLAQRNSEKIQRSASLTNSHNMVASEISTSVTDYQQAKKLVTLFTTGIIPQAKQAVDSMMAGYQVGKVDFLKLIQAQTALYNYETKYWRVYSRTQQALAQITAAIGGEIAHE